MDAELLKETFFTLVAPDLPNEWDVEEAVENLAGLDEHRCHSVLNQVPVIWPVSHSLCFDYLKAAAGALSCIEATALPGLGQPDPGPVRKKRPAFRPAFHG